MKICSLLPHFWDSQQEHKGHAVVQRVEALRYKPEGRGFDSQCCQLCRTMALGVVSASNRNEYQEYFLGGKGGQYKGLTTLTPSCADCLEIWEPQGLSRPVMGLGSQVKHGTDSENSRLCTQIRSINRWWTDKTKAKYPCVNVMCINPWRTPWRSWFDPMRYKPEGRRFYARLCHWNMSVT